MSCLGRANVRAFYENPNLKHTELTLITHKAYNHKMYVLCRPLKYLKPHRQVVWTKIRLLLSCRSSLVWVHNVYLYAYMYVK